MANKGIQEGNNGHPTEVVSEIRETGQLEVESGSKQVHKIVSQATHVAREGNGVDKRTSEAEKVGEGSQEAGRREGTVQGGETGVEGKAESQAELEVTAAEAETGEKRQRPAETGEVKEPQEEEGAGKKKAKRAKKATEKKGGEEKPLKKERKAKTTAKAKIQISETTTATKKRAVGRPRKSSATTTTKKDDGMEVVEAAPVQGETAEEAKTADPIT